MRNIKTNVRKLCLTIMVISGAALPLSAYSQTTDAVTTALETRADYLAKTNDFSGVVLLAKDDKVVFEKAYGYANRDFEVPNTIETKFSLASMNKMFTAMAIIRLFDEKGLPLNSKLAEILPDYPNAKIANAITIHQMLTHTSGLGFYWEGLDTNPRSKFDKLEDYVPLFVNDDLSIKPGSRFAYSNAGYIILGLIIEHLSGQDYHDYIDQTIFSPLGMHSTSSPRNDAITKNRAVGYSRSIDVPGQWNNNLYQSEFRGSSAGGGISTAHDLLKFATALQKMTLLSPAHTEIYTRPRVESHRGHYGYGIEISHDNGHVVIGHSGGHIGIASELKIFRDLGYTFIILSNGEFDNFHSIGNTVTDALIGPTEKTDRFRYTESVIADIIKNGPKAASASNLIAPAIQKTLSSAQLEQASARLIHQGKTNAALNVLEFYMAQFPNAKSAYYYLGDALRISGQPEKAIKAYDAYLAEYPEDSDAKRWVKTLEAEPRTK